MALSEPAWAGIVRPASYNVSLFRGRAAASMEAQGIVLWAWFMPSNDSIAKQLGSIGISKRKQLPELPRTILIADDDFDLARSLAADLGELGFKILGPASNGQAAIDIAQNERPDLALLDIRMPVLDGLAAAETLYAGMDIPIVILSAHSDEPCLQAGVRLGVFGYLLKPVSTEQLRVTLMVSWRRYCEHRRIAIELDELKLRFEQRKVIEKAKGILMKTMGLSEEDAMRTLQKQARDSRRPMFDLAQALLNGQSSGNSPQMGSEPTQK